MFVLFIIIDPWKLLVVLSALRMVKKKVKSLFKYFDLFFNK